MQNTLVNNKETATDNKEKRRLKRISLNLPIRVEGRDDPSDSWSEITRLQDISAFGAGLTLSRPVKRGRLIFLTIPMPRQMRCYDFMESQYRVWGIVRRCVRIENQKEEKYFVGVGFIGKLPPKSYVNNPAQLYEISHRAEEGMWKITHAPAMPDETNVPPEDRRHSRYQIPLNVTVEIIDRDGNVTESEQTVTENISLSGAAIYTTLPIESGSYLKITSMQYRTSIRAIVRGKRVGKDGIPRLHIEFIDHFFPLAGIENQ